MIESIGLVLRAACAGYSVSSPVGDVKRTVNESPYMRALATTRRRDVIACGPMKFFQAIACLPGCWREHRDDPVLVDQTCDCPRAIAAPVERLLLTPAPPPIARGLAGQFPERRGESGLGGVAEGGCNGDDRRIGIAQHVHGLLEPVLAQPGMR